jgi:hypothetical protein
MAFDVIGDVTTEEIWYKVPSGEFATGFSAPELTGKIFARFTFYSVASAVTPTNALAFLNSSNGTISSHTPFDLDTGSTANASELVVEIPAAAVAISFSPMASTLVFVRAEYSAVNYAQGINVTKYTTSQSITLTKTSSVALIGGGGSGAGGSGFNFAHGGGGSGYITSGSVTAGTYSLVIGSGAGGSGSSAGNPGGSTTFAGLTAAGGSGASSTQGGAGGSNGGNQGGTGGSNGSPGSGVVPTLFSGGPGGNAGSSNVGWNNGGGGGGVYGGGGGAAFIQGFTVSGGGGYGSGGGGGGGAVSQSQSASGGGGASGALYVLSI